MDHKWTLLTLVLIALTALVVTTGCSETQASAASQPTAQIVQREEAPAAISAPPTPMRDRAIATPTDHADSQPPVTTTVIATPTPQPTEAATRQPAPAVTSSPTAAPAGESPQAEVTVEAGNVRSGPGLEYPVVGQVGQGNVLTVLKRNEPGDWLQIPWDGESAWLSASLVTLNVDVGDIERAEAIAPPPASPTPATTPTPAPVGVPYCDTVPIRGFGAVWGEFAEVAATLGCPSWPYREQGTDAAVQIFEHGLMLWLAADSSYSGDPVYALFDTGEYQRFPDMGPADPAVVDSVPAGFHPPGDRFSKVYWEGTGARVRQRLGHAISSQIDSSGAYQQFGNGRMFWTGAVDRVFVLYDYWLWDETEENQVQIRSWTSFEDTFGD